MSTYEEDLQKFQEFYNTPERIKKGLRWARYIKINEEDDKDLDQKCEEAGVSLDDLILNTPIEVQEDTTEEDYPEPEEVQEPAKSHTYTFDSIEDLLRIAFGHVPCLSREEQEDIDDLIRELRYEAKKAGYPARVAFIREKIKEALGDKVSNIDIDLGREDWIDSEYNIEIYLSYNAPESDYDFVSAKMDELEELYGEDEEGFSSFTIRDYYIEGLYEKASAVMSRAKELGVKANSGKEYNEIVKRLRAEYYKEHENDQS